MLIWKNELEKLGWKKRGIRSIDPDEAYNFVSQKMQQDKYTVRKTALGVLIDRALHKISIDPKLVWGLN